MRSKFEERVFRDLTLKEVEFDYEKESFEYFLPVYQAKCQECGEGKILKRHWYTPDFFIATGTVVEVKGRFTAKDRKIAKAMREYHPEINMKYLFYADNKLTKKSETRYSDWCEQHGFDYAFKEIPNEWL